MQILNSNLSEGVLKEIESLKKYKKFEKNINFLTIDEIINNWGFNVNNFNNIDLHTRKLSILDIGVGKGQSSIYLASLGHEVWSVEPYIEYCNQIKAIAIKFDLKINVCNGTAEHIDQIKNKFDLVIFCASLHHCDDPNLALKLCFDSLKKDGEIRLYGETFLRPWQTKKGFQEKLKNDPISMGHYGGNEHAYHNWTYKKMLIDAGFREIKLEVPNDGSILDKIEYRLSRRIGDKRIDSNEIILILRIIYYIVQKYLSKFILLREISIFGVNFCGRK